MYAAFERRDGESALGHYREDVEFDFTRRPDGTTGHGRAELSALIASWIEAFEGWREEIEELRELGDRVYVVLTQRGRGRGSGIELKARYAMVYEVEDEEIARVTIYPDTAEALEAAGAS